MSSIFDLVSQAVGGDTTRQISNQLGVPEDAASKAIAAALPTLMGALARNASDGRGAGALAGALDRDHDGSVLDDVAGFLGRSGSLAGGEAILGHVLGGRRPQVENGIGKMAGLDAGSAAKLLAMLAPLVMGALGRAKRQRQVDAGGLGDLLQRENRRVERRAPNAMGMVGQLLDADGDGQVLDDVAGLLGGLLGGRR